MQPLDGDYSHIGAIYVDVDVFLSPTSDESRPLIGQLTRVYDFVCRGKSCMSG